MENSFSDADKKKAVFEAMSPRRQKYILNKVGYDVWDPFDRTKGFFPQAKGYCQVEDLENIKITSWSL